MSEVKFLFEPRNVVLIGSSKIQEKVGMTSPWLFENVIHNMNKFFEGKTFVLDIEENGTTTSLRICLKHPISESSCYRLKLARAQKDLHQTATML